MMTSRKTLRVTAAVVAVLVLTIAGHFKAEIHTECVHIGVCSPFSVGKVQVSMKAGWVGEYDGIDEAPLLRFRKSNIARSGPAIVFWINERLAHFPIELQDRQQLRWSGAFAVSSAKVPYLSASDFTKDGQVHLVLFFPEHNLVGVTTEPSVVGEILPRWPLQIPPLMAAQIPPGRTR